MQKTILLATSLALTAGLGLRPAAADDLPVLPALSPAPTPTLAAPPGNAFSLNVLYTGEAWDVAEGGLRRGPSYMYNVDARLQVDTDKAFGWTGGMFEAEGFYANATSTGNTYVGALDQQSPIDTAANVDILRLYQLFYDQNFGTTDVRFGIYDLETEFANTKPMALFLSKDLTWITALDQAGTMPENGTVGPGNYPYTPLALRIRQAFTPDFSIQIAAADGAADDPRHPANNDVVFSRAYGAMFIGEADYTPSKYTKLMVGAWDLTSRLPYFGQLNADGTQRMTWGEAGAYVGGATRLYSAGGKRGLDGFFTFGVSTPQSTNVAAALNTGLVYTGLFDSRPGDKMGVSMNINNASSDFRQMQYMQNTPIGLYETSFEATYRAKINDYLTIQPDIQYIANANYSRTLRNPVVLGIHFEIGHLFEW